jgi:recombination protein RecA
VIDVATEMGIVKKSGTWFSYEETRLGQGREKARDFIIENPTMMAEIDQKVRDRIQADRNALDASDVIGGSAVSEGLVPDADLLPLA